jgi:DNA-binding transcriptional ArsR family regulator
MTFNNCQEGHSNGDNTSAQLENLMRNARRASEFLKALAHETRLLLLCLLSERERSVTELETLLALRQPTVSQQLARLRLDGLVSTRREGKAIYYRLNGGEIQGIACAIHEIFCREQSTYSNTTAGLENEHGSNF